MDICTRCLRPKRDHAEAEWASHHSVHTATFSMPDDGLRLMERGHVYRINYVDAEHVTFEDAEAPK